MLGNKCHLRISTFILQLIQLHIDKWHHYYEYGIDVLGVCTDS